jgi:hypothetical protein
VKEYPGVSTILGNYRDEHNHALGNANLPFTQISKETREYIAGLLRLKVTPEHIVSCAKYIFLFLTFNDLLFLASSYPSRCLRWRRSLRAGSGRFFCCLTQRIHSTTGHQATRKGNRSRKCSFTSRRRPVHNTMGRETSFEGSPPGIQIEDGPASTWL